LDGVRGVAILAVMLFHFGWLPAGWIGVQTFFVLSGYLITSILMKGRSVSFRDYLARFYWRRMLRIFPLYFGFLISIAAFYAMTGWPGSFPNDWPWLFTHTANFARLRAGDLPNFAHLWSLAIEEQFYLVWPLVVFTLSRLSLRRLIAALLLGAPILRMIVFHALLAGGSDAAYAAKAVYVLPFTQFDSFAACAAISLFTLDRLKTAQGGFLGCVAFAAGSGAGTLVIAHVWQGGAFIASLGYPHSMADLGQYVWGYSLVNIVSMWGIVCALQRRRLTHMLEWSPLMRLGRISYGAYVYHLPLLVLAIAMMAPRTGAERATLFIAWAIAVFATSELSFRLIESPFLKLKDLSAFKDTRLAELRSH